MLLLLLLLLLLLALLIGGCCWPSLPLLRRAENALSACNNHHVQVLFGFVLDGAAGCHLRQSSIEAGTTLSVGFIRVIWLH